MFKELSSVYDLLLSDILNSTGELELLFKVFNLSLFVDVLQIDLLICIEL
jgi:hypothetical protein